jgi:hypothetical protein
MTSAMPGASPSGALSGVADTILIATGETSTAINGALPPESSSGIAATGTRKRSAPPKPRAAVAATRRRAADVNPLKLALVPALFGIWGLHDLVRLDGVDPATIGLWLLALAAGATLGMWLLRHALVSVDRTLGIIHRPGDGTVLPLILLAFGIKYGLGVIGAMTPALLQNTGFWVLEVVASGGFTGIFLGKYVVYLRAYFTDGTGRAAPTRGR